MGYVQNVSILEANRYAALNPGTVFILYNRDKTRYLTINEVNALTPDVLEVDGNVCEGIQGLKPNQRPPFTTPFGSGGGTGGGTNPNAGIVQDVDVIPSPEVTFLPVSYTHLTLPTKRIV